MENKTCKKCQRPLPAGYKRNKCEHCLNAQVQNTKKIIKGTLGATITLSSLAITLITNGKINPRK